LFCILFLTKKRSEKQYTCGPPQQMKHIQVVLMHWWRKISIWYVCPTYVDDVSQIAGVLFDFNPPPLP
jgi:hypothetical protein